MAEGNPDPVPLDAVARLSHVSGVVVPVGAATSKAASSETGFSLARKLRAHYGASFFWTPY